MASQQSARQPGLNPAQVRHVLATLAHVDAGFRHIESVIASRPTPFAREHVDVTADEAQALASFIAAARLRMLETCERLGIAPPHPDVSGRLSIETTLHFAGIAFADMSPGVLRGYGPIEPQFSQELAAISTGLDELMQRGIALLQRDRREGAAPHQEGQSCAP